MRWWLIKDIRELKQTTGATATKTHSNKRFNEQNNSYFWEPPCLKWMLSELSFSDRWSRGTKLWERDYNVK